MPDYHTDEDPTEIAERHDHIQEFGEAILALRVALDSLERNGHLTVGAWESIERAQKKLEVVGREEHHQEELFREEISRLVTEEGLSVEEALEEASQS